MKKYLPYQAGLSFVGLAVWLTKNFGTVTLDQLVFHLDFGGEALLNVDKVLVLSFLKAVVGLPALLAILLSIGDAVISRKFARGQSEDSARSGIRNNGIARLVRALPAWRGTVVVIAGVGFFLQSISAFAFLVQENFSDDYFVGNYVHPSQVRVEPKSPKNLVLIYVESLEASYADQELYGDDLIRGLTSLEGHSFGKFMQVPGTGWTMAGIVSSQCGMPLKNIFGGVDSGNDVDRSHRFNKLGQRMSTFLPGAVCLGDILHSHGYRNVFIGGAPGSFAGKEVFFRTHKYDEYYGKDQLELAGLTLETGVDWGYLNDQTLSVARKTIKRLHESKQRFNLTLLTLDTHGPDGLYSADCRRRGAKGYDGLVTCTSDQVTEFVDFMKQQGYLKDTRVLVMGDHLGMKTPISDKLPPMHQRSIFNKFIASEKLAFNRNEIVHFDLFPTLLEFIGFEVGGDRLGFGYSAINPLYVELPENRVENLRGNVLNRSSTYLEFWK